MIVPPLTSKRKTDTCRRDPWWWLLACIVSQAFALLGCTSTRDTVVGTHIDQCPVGVANINDSTFATPVGEGVNAAPVDSSATDFQDGRGRTLTDVALDTAESIMRSEIRPQGTPVSQSPYVVPGQGPPAYSHTNAMTPGTYEQPDKPPIWLLSPFDQDSSYCISNQADLLEPDQVFGEMDGPGTGPGGEGGPGDDPGPPGGFGGPGDEPGYSLAWYPSASVSGQDSELGIVRNRVGIDVPVWFQGADMVMLSLNVGESHFSSDTILPDTLRAFPSDLWSVQVGLKHMHQFENGWTSMLMFDVGSASDKPFNSLREMNFQIGGFLMIPAKNGRDMWMVGAMYSPLGNPSFPIPILSYQWKPSESFEMSIGIPSNIKWKPIDRLTIDIAYLPLMNINALATYEVTDQLSVYGGYQNVNHSWFLTGRADRQDQFVEVEQQLIVGVRRDFTETLSLDVSTGYAFGRYFGVGDGMGNSRSDLTDRVDLESGAFLSGRLNWTF